MNDNNIDQTNNTQNSQTINQHPSIQQPINQYYTQPTPQIDNNINNENNPRPQKKNKNIIIIIVIGIIILLLFIVIGFFAIKKISNKFSKSDDISDVTSKFEKAGDKYVLKDEKGNVLLDNIQDYGDLYLEEFCNGTIKVKSPDGKLGIINSKGKFIVGYGKYEHIEQTGCYYTVTNYDEKIKTKILKYDGSVFFEDEKDPYLEKSDIDCAVNFCFSKKVALFTTKGKYQLLDSKGNVIKEYNEVKDEEPYVSGLNLDDKVDRYITSYYNGSTDIIDTKSSKILKTVKGKYYIREINKKNEEQFILYKYDIDTEIRHAIIFNNGKQTFDVEECVLIEFDDDNIMCVRKDRIVDRFDINGNKVEKNE